MQLCKIWAPSGAAAVGVVEKDQVTVLDPTGPTLSEILAAPDVVAAITQLASRATTILPYREAKILAPIDRQEVWAAGVTYTRSKAARMEESEGAAHFYNLVYEASRPELFFKATPHRVRGPGEPLRIRADSGWSVPEPELALMLTPDLKIAGFTIGNDMSARDIEGENPLYLPQAKVYDQCAGLGPTVILAKEFPAFEYVNVEMTIDRGGQEVFRGTTPLSALHRQIEDLVAWLGKESSFPDGAILMTGTGIVPPDNFTLQAGDVVNITIDPIGTLTNSIVCGL